MLLEEYRKVVLDEPTIKNNDGYDVFVHGSSISPDGSIFIAIFSDRRIGVYPFGNGIDNSSDDVDCGISDVLRPRFHIKSIDEIRSVCFFPNYHENNPDSCCLLTASRGTPIHLYDTHKGQRHFTFKPNNIRDELAEVYSLNFQPLGKYFLGGSKSTIHVFDIEMPGHSIEVRPLSTRSGNKFGIVSAISHNPYAATMYACGDYNSNIGVFDHNESRQRSIYAPFTDDEHKLGPVKWFDDHTLLVGSRSDNHIRAFDIRGNKYSPIMRYHRPSRTNQRITFDVRNDQIVSGTDDGNLVIYNGKTGNALTKTKICDTVVSSASYHPKLPVIVTSRGTRVYSAYKTDDKENKTAIQLWKYAIVEK
eukprot:XP_001610671.1 hypothetical protein [Babesia bovis T2Bo]